MRRRIAWLVAATTSAVVLAFVVPLCLLVRTVAEERALAAGDQQARYVATLVSGVRDRARLRRLVEDTNLRSRATTSVLLPDGTVLGPADLDLALDPDVAAAADGSAFRTTEPDGAEIYLPVITARGTSVVQTKVGNDLLRAGVYRAWASIVGLGIVLLATAVVVAARLGRRISVPVTELAEVAERLQQGDLGARARLQGPEETVELAATLNRLAERIVELLAAERAAVGDLSHRLRTPVTALRLDVEAVDDRDLAERLGEHVGQLQRTVDAIVRDARRPLRSDLGPVCDAAAVVAERTAFWSALAEDQGRPVDITVPEGPAAVALDAADVRDILDVLVDNVFAHTPDGTGFAVRLGRQAAQVVLEVENRATTGRTEEGGPVRDRPGSTGLGLQIVRRTAARAGGHLQVESGPGSHLARVTLPSAPSVTDGHRPHAGQSSPPSP